ncbi:hypothetical protein G6F37_002172 [Rhizopus arrhizus]|nr:hypothetical protein G6F38_002368 [Rhizopus arrhizus]KAG1162415.1 hypothetical protein G6F37_002172 [Rhizopus arrhizus]
MTAEFYKVIYDYETDQKDELSVKEGELLRITNKENTDWWIAERLNQSNSFGLVPSNFLEAIQLGIVIQDYEAQNEQEVDLKKDDKVIIFERDEHWTKGELNGKTGIFPSNHVEEYSTERSKNGFKLAAYGVKQGGIGSILAGGLLKRTSVKENSENNTELPKVPSRRPSTFDNSHSKKIESTAAVKAMVLHDYSAENEDEIGLMRGEYITVIDQPEQSGWWKGTNESGQIGIFPSNFVQIIEQPPPRPTRARPPTVKSEDQPGAPPPIPVGTRPSSLLTSPRASPPSRPLTSPPIGRPVTSPPRRPPSINTKNHKRTPSIPVVSPDLPPLSPVHNTRPVIPRPTSSVDAAMNNMAKPPKINFTPKQHTAIPATTNTPSAPTIPVATPVLPAANVPVTATATPGPVAPPRPTSIQESHPPIPKRSMPPPPNEEIEKIIQKELDKLRQEFELKLQQERKRLEELIYSHFQK